ncbi:hypothetical protein [Streptomyces sp. NPDC007369]|uniref:hypothetical protein n=1 Tax=Streptomyces sp. NPDC007369 TaxID=3154589 RepID=UPI0033D2188F
MVREQRRRLSTRQACHELSALIPNLAAAAAWAAVSGVGLAAPVDADIAGYPVGRCLKKAGAQRQGFTKLTGEQQALLTTIGITQTSGSGAQPAGG